MKKLREKIKKCGEHYPKKHGNWYVLRAFKDYDLVLDDYNGHITIHKNTESTGEDNMYLVVYTFTNQVGYVKQHLANFWYGHVCHKTKKL